MPFEVDPFDSAQNHKSALRSKLQSEMPGVFPTISETAPSVAPTLRQMLDPQRLSEGYSTAERSISSLLDILQTSLHRVLPSYFEPLPLSEYSKLLLDVEHIERKGLDLGKIPKRLANCHGDFLVLQSRKDKTLSARPYCCGIRLCPLCTIYRANKSRDSVEDKVSRMNNHMLWTFTIRTSKDMLHESHAKITRWFAKLRRSLAWTEHVAGCVWVFEYKYKPEVDSWHPHIHAILDTKFLPFFAIQELWIKITGGSHSINFKGRISVPKSVKYILKYITKPAQTGGWPIWVTAEFLLSMQGKRLYGSTGNAYGLSEGERLSREIEPSNVVLGWLSTPHKWRDFVCGGVPEIRELIQEVSEKWGVDPWNLSTLPP